MLRRNWIELARIRTENIRWFWTTQSKLWFLFRDQSKSYKVNTSVAELIESGRKNWLQNEKQKYCNRKPVETNLLYANNSVMDFSLSNLEKSRTNRRETSLRFHRFEYNGHFKLQMVVDRLATSSDGGAIDETTLSFMAVYLWRNNIFSQLIPLESQFQFDLFLFSLTYSKQFQRNKILFLFPLTLLSLSIFYKPFFF